MNRKKTPARLCIFLLLLIFTTLIVIAPVHAQSGLEKVLQPIEDVVGGFFSRVSKEPATWMKVFVLIGLFAALYFAALKLKFPRNIAGVIAMVFALIGAVGIPGDALVYLMNMYGGIAVAIMIIGPALGLGYLSWKVHQEIESRFVYLILAIVWGIYLGIVMAFSESMQKFGTRLAGSVEAISIVTFLGVVAIIILLILFFTGGGLKVSEKLLERGESVEEYKKRKAGLKRKQKLTKLEERLIKVFEIDVIEIVNWLRENLFTKRGGIGDSKKIVRRINEGKKEILALERKIWKIGNMIAQKFPDRADHIKRIVGEEEGILFKTKNMVFTLGQLKEAVTAPNELNARSRLNELIEEERNILVLLSSLEREFLKT